MPLEHVRPDDLLPLAERREAGQSPAPAGAARAARDLAAASRPAAIRCDILIETSRHRISSLLPIRYGRMQHISRSRSCAARPR